MSVIRMLLFMSRVRKCYVNVNGLKNLLATSIRPSYRTVLRAADRRRSLAVLPCSPVE